MTTGLAYIPGSYAKNEEIVRLALDRASGTYSSVVLRQAISEGRHEQYEPPVDASVSLTQIS